VIIGVLKGFGASASDDFLACI